MSINNCSELDAIELTTEHAAGKEHDSGGRTSRKSNDIRLQDIEEQLEMAESRCNNLKDQLDYMKHMYGVNRALPTKTRKISNAKSPVASSIVTLDENTTSNDNTKVTVSINALPSRQKSNHIETDNTGAAVKTINNILNGITNSVNRLSEIHSQMATPRVKVSTGVSPRHENSMRDEVTQSKRHSVGIVPELKIESTSTLHPKTRGQKRKASKSAKTTSQHIIKKPSRFEKKSRSIIARSTAGLEKKSSTIIRNRFLSKFNSKNNNLVEIYHNDAVKHSDSDESNLRKSRQQRERQTVGVCREGEEVPPLNIHVLNPPKELHNDQTAKSELRYPVGFDSQFPFDPPHAPRTTVSCCYSKNYELPTVASRMKQVAKSYLGSLNLKTIPFCAAISTTQSHNIGINIQQVMNIIKNRQPINGISPTLAHNIGLAAEKLNSKPFTALVSTINSRISHTGSKCPLSRTYLNIQQLQEQARNIPEDTIEEADEEAGDSPKTHTMIITGPSGDMEIKTKNVPTWRVDKNTAIEQCTCVAQPSVGFQHVTSKYQRNIRTITENSLNSQIIENQLKQRLKRYKTTRNNFPAKNAVVQECQVQTTTTINQETQKEEALNGRERNLKEVLTNLHHDFDALNRKYENLSQKSQSDRDETSLKELERLEAELNKKEDEITMVMTLYKEVLALKQQVRQLKEKRSQACLRVKDPKDTKIKFKEYNNPEAAFHLTKLLKQIQHYQMRYKSNLSQE